MPRASRLNCVVILLASAITAYVAVTCFAQSAYETLAEDAYCKYDVYPECAASGLACEPWAGTCDNKQYQSQDWYSHSSPRCWDRSMSTCLLEKARKDELVNCWTVFYYEFAFCQGDEVCPSQTGTIQIPCTHTGTSTY